MQSTHRSSKGKDRAGDDDYAQSLASLSLSDYGEHLTPRSDSYGTSYADSYGSSYVPPYTSDVYSWTVQTSLAATHSSSPPYGSTPGYGSTYPTTSALSSIGGYGSQSEPDRSTYSYYTGYDAASVSSSSVPSSDGGASVSGWSETRSNGTGRESDDDQDDDQGDDRSDVNNTIHRQRPRNDRYQLPCEFHNLTGCTRVFSSDNVQDWVGHIEGHLQEKFPTRLRCWFCSEQDFDARETSKGDVRSNFNLRMQHIRQHIIYEGYHPEQMLKDSLFIKHLIDHNIIDKRTYESIIYPTSLPPLPGSRHRSSNHHRRLPQVEEEVVAESSSRHHHRSEKHHRDRREHGGGHHRGRKSELAARHRYPSERISAPGVDPPDDAVLRSLRHPPSSPYSSSNVLGNTSLEGSSVSNRNTTSRNTAGRNTTSGNSENRCVGHAGDETATNSVADKLHQNNIELVPVEEKSTCPPERIESPQSQDHSSDGLSSFSTDASTPESGSFWLVEYSEEEDNRLDEDHIFNQFRASAIARVIEAFNAWKETHLDQDLPSDGAGGAGKSNQAPNQGKGKGKDTSTGKRTWADQAGIGEDTADNSGPSSNQVGRGKRPQTSAQQLPFACPYTKKDPRSHGACYKYKLSRIRDVKQHLVRRHWSPLYCPVCMSIFQTEDERDDHVRERSCEPRPSIRLDGITESQGFQLAKKSAAYSTEEAQWYAVFDIVFPGHKPRPLSPYVNPELIQDITLFENFLMSDGPRVVSEVFTQHGVSNWNLPNEERERAAFLRPVFEEGFSLICEQWRARSSSSSQDSNAPSGSGSSSLNTPPSSSNSREGVGPHAVHDSRAVPPVTAESPPDGGPLDALPEGMDIPDNSADHFPFGEGLDGNFDFEHGGVEFPARPTYDVDDITRLMMDDAEASSSFQLGWTEVADQMPEHWRSEHRQTPSAN